MATEPEFVGERTVGVELGVVGQRQPRLDGPQKVSGRSVFSDDVVLPGMLCGKILRSRHSHARIVRLDTSKAEALPGVKAVITARDAQGIKSDAAETAGKAAKRRTGTEMRLKTGETVFCGDVTHYIGERLPRWPPLTGDRGAGFGTDRGRVRAAPCQPGRWQGPSGRPTPVHQPGIPTNIWAENVDNYGDPNQAFAAADFVLEESFEAAVTSLNLFAEYHVAVVDFSRPDK